MSSKNRVSIKTVRTLMRAIDEGDETIDDFCQGEYSDENRERVRQIVIQAIKRGFVEHGDGPPVSCPSMLTYKLTALGRQKFRQDEHATRHGLRDAETGMSRSAMMTIASAIKSQPVSIFNYASFFR